MGKGCFYGEKCENFTCVIDNCFNCRWNERCNEVEDRCEVYKECDDQYGCWGKANQKCVEGQCVDNCFEVNCEGEKECEPKTGLCIEP